jgi:hypothetical protein
MSFQTSTRLLHFRADGIEQSEKPELLTQNLTQSKETLNRIFLDNFLHFLMVIYTPSYDKRSRSCDVLTSTRLLKFLGISDLSNLRILNF